MDYLSPIEAMFPGVGSAVLRVLAQTSESLTVRQVAERAGATHPQVGRHARRLEALGVVDRRIVGRSHLLTLSDSAAAQAVRRLAHLRDAVTEELRSSAAEIVPPPVSLILFGSFARGEAQVGSDVDVLVVCPPGDADDPGWNTSLGRWVDHAAVTAGNPVTEIVVEQGELQQRLSAALLDNIVRDGVVLVGRPLDEILGPVDVSVQGD